MVFQVGHYYKHTSGYYISIICETKSAMHGRYLLAEITGPGNYKMLKAVGDDEASAEDFREISYDENNVTVNNKLY